MTTNSPQLTQVYDIPTLLEYCMGDVEFAGELLERFQARLSESFDSLETYLREGQTDEAARLVHSLKGEAGSLAASRLHEAATSLEDMLRSPNPPAFPDLLDELQEAVQQCLSVGNEAQAALARTQL